MAVLLPTRLRSLQRSMKLAKRQGVIVFTAFSAFLRMIPLTEIQ